MREFGKCIELSEVIDCLELDAEEGVSRVVVVVVMVSDGTD